MKRISEKRLEEQKLKKVENDLMRNLFLEIWDERQDSKGYCTCFETGTKMHRNRYRELSICYDHVLEKQQYPEYKFVKKNIVIVLPEVHTQKGMNLTFVPKLNKYREYLLNLHEEGKMED